MCCLAKCLLGVLFGWVIFFVNLAAAGALLAGAFAPWASYSSTPTLPLVGAVQVNFLVAGLGVAGTSSSSGFTIPSGTTIASVSSALAAAARVNASIPWAEPANVNVAYLGMGAQVAAAASILAYTLISSFLCLCTLCCCCCPQAHSCNALIAVAKAGVALVGVAAMGAFFLALDAALKAAAASPAALAAVRGVSAVTADLALAAAGTEPGVGPGKGLGALGVALLGANVVLHVLQAIKCGGALHHPEKVPHKAPAGGCCRR
jgi:hypothetical protein